MKQVVIIAIFFVCFALTANAQPKLEVVGGNTYDWGKVTPKVLTTKIQIKNIGNKTLFISKVKPSCGCTTAPMDRRTLEPGEIGTMSVNMSLDISVTGKVVKKIDITSNDPITPDTTIYLQCMVVTPIEVKPHAFFKFDNLQVGYESSSTVTIKNMSDTTITLSNFEIHPEFVTINVANQVVLKPGESFDLTAKLRPSSEGQINITVKFNLSHPDLKQFTVSGYADVKPTDLFKF
ncbi:MAG: DUF1573 domain-containing protein [bacterium]